MNMPFIGMFVNIIKVVWFIASYKLSLVEEKYSNQYKWRDLFEYLPYNK